MTISRHIGNTVKTEKIRGNVVSTLFKIDKHNLVAEPPNDLIINIFCSIDYFWALPCILEKKKENLLTNLELSELLSNLDSP